MYTYEGTGYLIPVSSITDDLDSALAVLNAVTGTSILDYDDLANECRMGDFEPTENIDTAYLDNDPVDSSMGIFICREEAVSQRTVGSFLDRFGVDPGEFYGTFIVECWQ